MGQLAPPQEGEKSPVGAHIVKHHARLQVRDESLLYKLLFKYSFTKVCATVSSLTGKRPGPSAQTFTFALEGFQVHMIQDRSNNRQSFDLLL
jgi:hypothetical protein